MTEATESRSVLESLLGRPVTGFSYPYGAHDAPTIDAVRRAGYRYAVTVQPGLVECGGDIYRLPRCEVKARIAPTFERWLADRVRRPDAVA